MATWKVTCFVVNLLAIITVGVFDTSEIVAQQSSKLIEPAVEVEAASTEVSATEKAKAEQDDLERMQGRWVMQWATGEADDPGEVNTVPYFLYVMSNSKIIDIRQNQLNFSKCYENQLVSMTTDFSGPGFEAMRDMDVVNGTLIMLTLPNGKPIFASYNLSDTQLTLRYPAGCCTRSGTVVNFTSGKTGE